MKMERLPPVKTSLRPSNHPYLNGAWTPIFDEVDATDLDVIEGAIPTDIDGVYVRNTENHVHQPLGRYHPFDGDGMLHMIDVQGRPRRLSQSLRPHQRLRGRAGGRPGRCGAG